MEPDEKSRLVADAADHWHRVSLAKLIQKAQKDTDASHAELLDQPIVFAKFAGDSRTSPNSSWRSIIGDKFQVRLVALAALLAGLGLCLYAFSNNVILFLSVRAELAGANNVGPQAPESLPDVVHELLGPLGLKDPGPARVVIDIIPYTILPLGVFYMFYCGETRRIVNLSGVLFFLLLCNGIAGTVTVMPDAHPGGPQWCFSKFDDEAKEKMKTSGVWMMNLAQGAFACNDMMWSGHTMNTAFGVMIFDRVLKQRHTALVVRVLLWSILVVYCFLLLGVRVHYSSDVFIALLLAVSFFHHAPFTEWIWASSCWVVGLRAEDDAPYEEWCETAKKQDASYGAAAV